jgi:hypothetical protein
MMSRSTARTGVSKPRLPWALSGEVASNTVGRPMATKAMAIRVKFTWTSARLKRRLPNLSPARRRLVPRTSSSCPRMEPMSAVRTTMNNPWLRANTEIVNSAAFPKVALSNPPETGPSREPRVSVA